MIKAIYKVKERHISFKGIRVKLAPEGRIISREFRLSNLSASGMLEVIEMSKEAAKAFRPGTRFVMQLVPLEEKILDYGEVDEAEEDDLNAV